MRILALETSHALGSVAVLEEGKTQRQLSLNPEQRSAQSLAPAIHSLLAQAGWRPADVELIAVTTGPGSFTSLRVGVATAKTLAYAVDSQVLGLGTLDVIAAQSSQQPSGRLLVGIDAGRGQAFAGEFRVTAGAWQSQGDPELLDLDRWLARASQIGAASGPLLHKVAARLPEAVHVGDPNAWDPQAATVARLAADRYAAGMRNDLWQLAPLYIRPSAAEERWQEKHKGSQ